MPAPGTDKQEALLVSRCIYSFLLEAEVGYLLSRSSTGLAYRQIMSSDLVSHGFLFICMGKTSLAMAQFISSRAGHQLSFFGC